MRSSKLLNQLKNQGLKTLSILVLGGQTVGAMAFTLPLKVDSESSAEICQMMAKSSVDTGIIEEVGFPRKTEGRLMSYPLKAKYSKLQFQQNFFCYRKIAESGRGRMSILSASEQSPDCFCKGNLEVESFQERRDIIENAEG